MAERTFAEEQRIGAEIEQLAQQYYQTAAYKKAMVAKAAATGVPPAETGDIYGTPEQISERLQKRYELGEIPQDVSAEITENPETPGQQMIIYSKTPQGRGSTITRWSNVGVEKTQPMPEGKLQYKYNLGVDYPEQVEDVKRWAASHGKTPGYVPEFLTGKKPPLWEPSTVKVERVFDNVRTASYLNKEKEAQIQLLITTNKPLPADAAIDIRSGETVHEARTLRSARDTGRQIFEQASPIEKALYNVRTFLSPAGAEYVGAVAHTPAGIIAMGPSALTALPIIDYFFPNIKSPAQVVTEDIERRTIRQATGQEMETRGGLGEFVKIAYHTMGQKAPDAVISAVDNPAVEVELMALGGAGLAKAAATTLGAKFIGSAAGKIGAGALTAAYVGEKAMQIQTARLEGRSTEALGQSIIAAAGLVASYGAFKAEYSHIMTARAQLKIPISKMKIRGGSESKQTEIDIVTDRGIIEKGSTVSKGKFKIVEGELKGLRGETYSVSGESTGKLRTYIPKQTLRTGKTAINIPEQDIIAGTKFGETSVANIKAYWRKAGTWLIGHGKESQVIGPDKSNMLMREVGRKAGTIRISTDIEGGGKVTVGKEAIVRKFSGISAGKSARKYDLYMVQQGGKPIIVEKAILGSKSIAKIDWVDITYTKSAGAATMNVYAGGIIKTAPGPSTVSAVKLAPPPTPGAITIKAIASQSAIAPKLVWHANPTAGPGVMIKPMQKVETITIEIGTPTIIRSTTKERERAGTVVQRSGTRSVTVPSIKRAFPTTTTTTREHGLEIAIPITHPITGQKVSQAERAAVLSKLNPIIGRIANQPVPVPPVPVDINIPSIGGPGIGLIPFLRMGNYNVRIAKFGKGVIVNPVPNIERLI